MNHISISDMYLKHEEFKAQW